MHCIQQTAHVWWDRCARTTRVAYTHTEAVIATHHPFVPQIAHSHEIVMLLFLCSLSHHAGVSLGSKARIEEDTEAKRMATHRAAAARSAIAAERHAKTLERRIAGMNEQAANALASQRGHEERITLMKEKLNISPATTAVPGLLALKSSSVSTAVSGSSSPVSALESTRMRMFAEQSRLRVLAVKRKAELRRLTAEAEKARRRTFVMLPVQQQQQQSPTDSS